MIVRDQFYRGSGSSGDTDDRADRDGDHASQDTGSEIGTVFLLDDRVGDRDGEERSSGPSWCQDQAAKVADGFIFRQLHCCG
jgi:hypothetical protein